MAQQVEEALKHLGRHGLRRSNAPAIVRLISAIASRFSVVITEETAAKLVPIIGALTGGAVNLMFMQHFQVMAHGHFAVRRLELKYGAIAVKRKYDEVKV